MIKSFKEKYIKSLFFYHIYRYFKYKFRFFKSYGATGEDVLINKIFRKNNGFYVDVGALHPINGSLTYNLYKRGWFGINFDMLDENIKLLKFFRKYDQSVNIAISSSSGKVNSYIFHPGSGLNTLEKKWADKWALNLKKNYLTKKVEKTTLTNILNKLKVNNHFDLLNIDVEGHEYEVLDGLDLKKFRPRIITVEIHVEKTEAIFTTRVFKYLKKNNYELISHYFHTSFFKAEEFIITEI